MFPGPIWAWKALHLWRNDPLKSIHIHRHISYVVEKTCSHSGICRNGFSASKALHLYRLRNSHSYVLLIIKSLSTKSVQLDPEFCKFYLQAVKRPRSAAFHPHRMIGACVEWLPNAKLGQSGQGISFGPLSTDEEANIPKCWYLRHWLFVRFQQLPRIRVQLRGDFPAHTAGKAILNGLSASRYLFRKVVLQLCWHPTRRFCGQMFRPQKQE